MQSAPVTLDDLHAMEKALLQSPNARFTTPQRLFFEALLSDPDMNVGRAAKKAGVRPGTAQGWMSNPNVQTALNHLLQQRMRRLGLDKDALLARIVSLLDMSMGVSAVKKVVYDAKLGGFIADEVYETDLAAAARFTDQLGRHLQLFQPEGSQGVSVNVQLNLAGDTTVAAATATVVTDSLDGPSSTQSASVTLDLGADALADDINDPEDISDLLE